MSRPRRDDSRLLSEDEQELVSRTRQPAIKDLADDELAQLVQRLRSQRNRARDIASRQRREMRGKSAPSGAKPASDDSGTWGKRDLLTDALKRANKEKARRLALRARGALVANAQHALALKQASDRQSDVPPSRTADPGMKAVPNETIAASGALEQEGHRPVLERSRKVR
jgi:hypothetical protein